MENNGECPNCGGLIGTMLAAKQFHKCEVVSDQPDDCRAAFEAWWYKDNNSGAGYREDAYKAWQAAWKPEQESQRSDEILETADVQALLIAYDTAKERGLPLASIQMNVDTVRELLANTPEREVGYLQYLEKHHEVTEALVGTVGLYLKTGDYEAAKARMAHYKALLPKHPLSKIEGGSE